MRYLDYLLYIENFEAVLSRIYPPELHVSIANASNTEAPFLDLYLSISYGFVSSKLHDKRVYFDFDTVIFFLVGDILRSTF